MKGRKGAVNYSSMNINTAARLLRIHPLVLEAFVQGQYGVPCVFNGIEYRFWRTELLQWAENSKEYQVVHKKDTGE